MHEWLHERRMNCRMQFEPMSFAESKEWRMAEGGLHHISGGFFSVQGVVAESKLDALDGCSQPIVNQPEIGILGFIVSGRVGACRWLVQAKAEPGNIASVQLAPSVQATHSNYMRRHGGAATPYLDFFLNNSGSLASDSLQSEQGTRFLEKFNRNAICFDEAEVEPASEHYRWIPSAAIRNALATSYAINTDARSVIVASPWYYVAGEDGPFSAQQPYHAKLHASYNAPIDGTVVQQARHNLEKLRDRVALKVKLIPLEELSGWLVGAERVYAADKRGAALEIRHYHVYAPEREKETWDQPLVLSPSIDEVVLLCQKRDGCLQFLLRPAYEIGLSGGVEYGPSFKQETASSSPAWMRELTRSDMAEVVISIEQSDEGGRFMQACCRYSVVELPETSPVEPDSDNFWVTLRELECLCAATGVLTNEARSVVSLLLSFS